MRCHREFVADKSARDRFNGVLTVVGLVFFISSGAVPFAALLADAEYEWGWIGLPLFVAFVACLVVLEFTDERRRH